jgi:hypothetical protein
MSQAFKFKAYVISVLDERRICVRISQSDLDNVTNRLIHYSDKTTVKDTVTVNITESRFSIDIDWNELVDLIGVQVEITAILRKYNFSKTKANYDDHNECRYSIIQCKGVSFIAKKITNCVS